MKYLLLATLLSFTTNSFANCSMSKAHKWNKKWLKHEMETYWGNPKVKGTLDSMELYDNCYSRMTFTFKSYQNGKMRNYIGFSQVNQDGMRMQASDAHIEELKSLPE